MFRKTMLLLAAALLAASCHHADKEAPEVKPGTDATVEEETAYVEIPRMNGKNPDLRIITHHAETYRTHQHLRNYTACYDVRRHNPLWVAYPLHDCYTEGGFTRPQKDPWRPDPSLKENEQSVIYAKDWKDWPWKHSKGKPKDQYNYWSPVTENFAKYQGFIKGHLLRSADRGAGRKDVLLDMNVQTFYPTNIAPERYYEVRANIDSDKDLETLNHWTIVEGIAPDQWKCKDTLYIVAGCWYDKEEHTAIDASSYGTRTDKSKTCIVPDARYKVFLRTKDGNSGKPVSACKADELQAIAFWFPQCFDYSNEVSELPALRSVTMTVAELEKKIGGDISFFPGIPAQVKKTYRVNDWPDLANVIDQPLDENYRGGYIFF